MQSWKSPRTESDELELSRNTTEKVLQKLLKFQMYMDQLLQSLLEHEKENYEFGEKMISYVEPTDNLLDKCIFSDSATFHLSGKVNRQ